MVALQIQGLSDAELDYVSGGGGANGRPPSESLTPIPTSSPYHPNNQTINPFAGGGGSTASPLNWIHQVVKAANAKNK